MKVKEIKDKILITEIDPNKYYICLINKNNVRESEFSMVHELPRKVTDRIAFVGIDGDIDKCIRFIEIPSKEENL